MSSLCYMKSEMKLGSMDLSSNRSSNKNIIQYCSMHMTMALCVRVETYNVFFYLRRARLCLMNRSLLLIKYKAYTVFLLNRARQNDGTPHRITFIDTV